MMTAVLTPLKPSPEVALNNVVRRSSSLVNIAIALLCLQLLSISVSFPQSGLWRQRLAGRGFSVGLNPLNPNSVYGQGAGTTLYQTVDGGLTWTLVGNPGISDIRQILVHPRDTSTLFVVGESPAGLERSTDGGKTWTNVLPNFIIDGESIAVDPLHPDTMYAGNLNNGDIYKSLDRGVTWTHTGVTGTELCTIAVRPDSSNVLYAGTGNGIISKSTDQGATWRKVKSGGSQEIPKIVINESNPMIAYAIGFAGTASADGLWKTTDGGETWNLVCLPGVSLWALEVDQTNPSTIYTGTFSPLTLTIYKSTDGGSTASPIATGLPAGSAWNLKVHPMMPSRPWLGLSGAGTGGVYQYVQSRGDVHGALIDSVSNDTVKSGTITLTLTGEKTDIALTAGKFKFGYFEDGTTLSSSLHIEAYPYRVRDIPFSFIRDSSLDQPIRLQHLPTTTLSGLVRDSASLQPLKATVSLTVKTPSGISRFTDSTDAGGHFSFSNLYISAPPVVQYQRMTVSPSFPSAQRSFTPVVLDSAGLVYDARIPTADVLVVAENDTAFYAHYFTDELDSLRVNYYVWDALSSGSAPFARVKEVRKKTIIFYTGDRLASLTKPELDSITACLSRGCNLFLTGQNMGTGNNTSSLFVNYFGITHLGISSTTDLHGVAGELLSDFVFSIARVTGAQDQSTPAVFHLTTATGKPLLTYDAVDTVAQIAGLRFENIGAGSKAVLFGFGFEAIGPELTRRGVLQKILDYFDKPLSAPNVEVTLTPGKFDLEQNFPNPFNPATRVRFSVSNAQFVSLAVFDALGRELTKLVNEQLAPGIYNVRWDASPYPSGVYFYRLTAGSFTATRKMVVLK